MNNPKVIEDELIEKIAEAKVAMQSDMVDGQQIDRLDGELTALMSNVAQIRAGYENHANTWKMYHTSVQEVVRSLRRMHETINTVRQMGG